LLACRQTEYFVPTLKKNGASIRINCDSQGALKGVWRTRIDSKIMRYAVEYLNDLGESNDLTLNWVRGHGGNKRQ